MVPWLELLALCGMMSCCGWYAGWRWYHGHHANHGYEKYAPEEYSPRESQMPPSPSRMLRRQGSVWQSTTEEGGGLPLPLHLRCAELVSMLPCMGGGPLDTLQGALRRLGWCRELWLTEVDDAAAAELALALRERGAARLEVLGLGAAVGDRGGALLADALARGAAPNLAELHLSGNRLGDATACAIARAMRAGGLPHLVELRLNHNEIGDDGAAELAAALLAGAAPRLEGLWLGGNRVGDRGAEQLARALRPDAGKACGRLRQLALYSNEVGDRGALALADALEARGRAGAWSDADVRAAFARFDANRSGKLDHRELRAALRQLGLEAGEEEATALLQRHDANNNGLLDVREFGAFVRQLGRRGTIDLRDGAAWQTAQSDDGRQYFFNDETGESTWKRPAALDAKPRPAARATPRRTAVEPPLSPATVPRRHARPNPCHARVLGTHVTRPATRLMPRASCHAPCGAPCPCTVRHALQHNTPRCSSPSTR